MGVAIQGEYLIFDDFLSEVVHEAPWVRVAKLQELLAKLRTDPTPSAVFGAIWVSPLRLDDRPKAIVISARLEREPFGLFIEHPDTQEWVRLRFSKEDFAAILV